MKEARGKVVVERALLLGLMGFILAGISCRSTTDYNPFADIGAYDAVVIEDFQGPGNTGYAFAERIARSFAIHTHFDEILREPPDTPALRVRGEIARYYRGNPAMRIRYGHNIGNARFAAEVRIEDYESGNFVASFTIAESYDTTKDRERVNQSLDTLMERAAISIAEKVRDLAME